jgi:ABC-type proline/glycine betaine transport system, permease component
MELLTKFPVMERSALAELRKGIDFAFRDFSRAYGDAIEAFFDPLLFFLVWLEKLLIEAPWPITIAVILWFSMAWL